MRDVEIGERHFGVEGDCRIEHLSLSSYFDAPTPMKETPLFSHQQPSPVDGLFLFLIQTAAVEPLFRALLVPDELCQFAHGAN